ncbi:hypothetical protein KKG22_03020 [Patescibacteria group bacterium]|nr:hypothetical protein [Patescibacteria group bacterium]MBU1721446.1 hypothetical protein [Patescibacteria group bacterium]MBU1901302.1 hypothetical protein [Patescibacteria group bacterium]
MYTILPFIVLIVSLAIGIFIIVRKFPQLTLLDVENLPEIKEKQKKHVYIKKRAEKKTEEIKKKHAVGAKALSKKFNKVQAQFRGYVGQVEHRIHRKKQEQFTQHAQQKQEIPEKVIHNKETEEETTQILRNAEEATKQQKLERAEAKYIEAIRVDHKNVRAYRGLIDVYIEQKQFIEAKETALFLLQLDPEDDKTHVRLAQIFEMQGERGKAIAHYQKAVLLADNNPAWFAQLAKLFTEEKEYEAAFEAIEQALELDTDNIDLLDNSVELGIMVADKNKAVDYYERLRLLDPDNPRLISLKQKIETLPS